MSRASVFLLWVAAVLLQGVAAAAELRVGMETRLAPWAFVPDLARAPTPNLSAPEMAKLTGLDVDVANALARVLKVRTNIVPTDWYQLESGLVEGHYDVILSAWTPSPRMPAGIVASTPYCDWGLVVVARADDARIRSFEDVKRLRVGHMDDPAIKQSLWAMKIGRLVPMKTVPALFGGLASKDLDAVIYDSLYVRWSLSQGKTLRIVGEPLNKLGYHIGMRRSDTALVELVQAALRTLKESGELTRIVARWEGR